MKFREHQLAHQLLDGLKGIEIGGSAHNPFNLPNCLNVDRYGNADTIFKKEELKFCGESLKVDVVAPADDLPFPPNSLDYIVNSHVLEHCYDVLGTIEHWLSKIRPGGWLFMIIPDKRRTFDKDRPLTTIQELVERRGIACREDAHHNVWTFESFRDVTGYLHLNVVYSEPVDSKVGNGFTIVVRKSDGNDDEKRRMDGVAAKVVYSKVNVVIVTYGNRWHRLNGLLLNLENDPAVCRVIVVDNASPYDVRANCERALFKKTTVYRNESNTGSAGGFAQGITVACQYEKELVLLLDDDNMPRQHSIRQLIDTYSRLILDMSEELLIVMGYRESQYGKFRVPVKEVSRDKDGFLNFNIFTAIQRHITGIKSKGELESGTAHSEYFYGNAYSGLLFSPRLVGYIGLPRPEFMLYFDDVEFTIRVLAQKGVVWLEKSAHIDDAEENYSQSLFAVPIVGFTHTSSSTKIFYLVRNWVYVYENILGRRSIYFVINKYLWLLLVVFVCVVSLRYKRLRAILQAVRDGMRGRLGIHADYPL